MTMQHLQGEFRKEVRMRTNIVECVLCGPYIDVSNASPGTALDIQRSYSPHVILKSKNNIAILGLGALTPGYILIVPKRHYFNIGQLNEMDFSDFLELKAIIGSHIQSLYGGVVFFEHGSHSSCATSGACIEHAHMHVLPSCNLPFRECIPSKMKEFPISDFEKIRDFSANEQPYLFLEEDNGDKYVYPDCEDVTSQFFRRIWARLLDRHYEYDWAVFPEIENMQKTFSAFSHKMREEILLYQQLDPDSKIE